MISSMTAFARQEDSHELGNFSWELRSVNHRYLDLSIRMPEQLRFLEPLVRQKMTEKIARGKVEAILNFNMGCLTQNLSINHKTVKQLLTISHELNQLEYAAPLSMNDILKWPGVVEANAVDLSKLEQPILATLENCLTELVTMRHREGHALAELLLQKLDYFLELFQSMQQKMPGIIREVSDKLKERIAELKLELEMQRFEQELILLVHKYDVTEEIDRLHTHIQEVYRVVKEGGIIGRKLDFFMQELNREANTLGSKAIDKELTHYVVDFKVIIEQMREQIQNLE